MVILRLEDILDANLLSIMSALLPGSWKIQYLCYISRIYTLLLLPVPF